MRVDSSARPGAPFRWLSFLLLVVLCGIASAGCGSQGRESDVAGTLSGETRETPSEAATASGDRGALVCPSLEAVKKATGGEVVAVAEVPQTEGMCSFSGPSASGLSVVIQSEAFFGSRLTIEEARVAAGDPAQQIAGYPTTVEDAPGLGGGAFTTAIGNLGEPGAIFTVTVPRRDGSYAVIGATQLQDGVAVAISEMALQVAAVVPK